MAYFLGHPVYLPATLPSYLDLLITFFSHSLLNPHQSAYRRHHSTETSLLYILDHFITAISSQKLSCLCLLDLSVAFDTIDHDILLTRLSSWFGIHGSVLNWFKSYLSSRTFCVKCNDCFSSLHTSLYGVPQGSVLGSLLFIMYTTPLSTLISSLSLYHHLYADETQLFLSFRPSDFQTSISHLQNALTQITSWLTSNQRRRAIEAIEARPHKTVWRLWLTVYRTELKVSLCA